MADTDREWLTEEPDMPPLHELFERIRRLAGGSAPLDVAADAVRADRDAR